MMDWEREWMKSGEVGKEVRWVILLLLLMLVAVCWCVCVHQTWKVCEEEDLFEQNQVMFES